MNLKELINEIKIISKSIEELYIELIEKELKNIDNASTLEKLKTATKLEDSLYDKMPKDTKTLIMLKNDLIKETKDIRMIELYTKMGKYELSDYRVLNEIERTLLEDQKYVMYQFMPDELKGLFDLGTVNFGFLTDAPIFEAQKLYNSLESDIIEILLSVLENKINSPFYKNIKEDLIKSRYGILFMNKNIEQNHIKNNYQINDEVYLGYKLTADFYNLSQEVINPAIDSYICEQVADKIGLLLEYTDNEYEKKDTKVITEVISSYLRSALQLASINIVNETNEEFHNILDNPEYTPFLSDKNKSIEVIISAYKNYKMDKTKIRTLSLKL